MKNARLLFVAVMMAMVLSFCAGWFLKPDKLMTAPTELRFEATGTGSLWVGGTNDVYVTIGPFQRADGQEMKVSENLQHGRAMMVEYRDNRVYTARLWPVKHY